MVSKGKDNNVFGQALTNSPAIKITNRDNEVSYTLVLRNTDSSKLYFDNLVVSRQDGGTKAFVLRYEPEREWYYGPRKIENYTGRIAYYSLDGERVASMLVENGKRVDRATNKIMVVCELERYVSGQFCVGGVYDGVLECGPIYDYHTVCTYSGGDSGGSATDDNPSMPDYDPNPDDTGTGGNGGDGGTTTTPLLEDDRDTVEDNIIIDFSIEEYPCLAKVINKIINSDSHLFKETIGRFMDNPEYDIIFKIGECANTENACTDGDLVEETGEIFVKIEDTNQNPIDFAAMILHEGIHAEIYRYVKEHHEGYVDPNDKPQLFEYYQYYKVHEPEPTEIDHIYMTQYYINPIAEALRKLDNNQYPINYYKPFAWDGLREYDPNNSLGIIDDEYSQYRNEVTLNFNIKCNE